MPIFDKDGNVQPDKGLDSICEGLIAETLETLRYNKPADRSEKARAYAVTITELEKVYAYFKTYVLDAEEESSGQI